MAAKIIDGKAIAEGIREKVKVGVTAFKKKYEYAPGLATVLVGDDPASQSYVRMKHRACESLGIQSFHHSLPVDADQAAIIQIIESLNQDRLVSGILVQLPLPNHVDEEAVLGAISRDKDVDGFHPINIGRLAQQGRKIGAIPCTPNGVIKLLKDTIGDLSGKHAVIIGRSNIVGMPTALLLIRENATVTICHSKTNNLPEITQLADILVVAVGRTEMVRGNWIKPGAVVIDVGINRVEDATKKRGYRIVGDVAFDEAIEIAGAITPVPGGVGPMTIAMLMRNTLWLAEMLEADKTP
ncbi:MAG: bifunctional methylenetetrahydrofolate dehydrogenase/methenyltetrahydrofolate cyclohydrolase FolD [Anaerolineaceae bacterium]|nr:bifunctional methylenetetrahydrofolate dehydrogenase/methenyltetrahydrofolate cyclohydrolase FolD [Anaerolineaceae bacterium]